MIEASRHIWFRFCLLATFIAFLVTTFGCGGGGGGASGNQVVDFTGTLVSATGSRMTGISVALSNPTGYSPDRTDSNGQFMFQFNSDVSGLTFAFSGGPIKGFSNFTVSNIPTDATTIELVLSYNASSNTIFLVSKKYTDANGNPLPRAPTIAPLPTVPSSVTKVPTPIPTSGIAKSTPTNRPVTQPTIRATATSAPRVPTATPRPIAPTAFPTSGNFDSSGNTTKFGIPAGLIGNRYRGASIWASRCSGCHGSKDNRRYSQVINSYQIPAMFSLHMTNAQTADLVAYLNRNNN